MVRPAGVWPFRGGRSVTFMVRTIAHTAGYAGAWIRQLQQSAGGVESPYQTQGVAMLSGPYGIVGVIVAIIVLLLLLRLLGVI